MHLRIVELNSSSGTDVPIEQLEGLTGAQLTGAGGPGMNSAYTSRCRHVHVRGRHPERCRRGHVFIHARPELPGGARQTRVREAHTVRACTQLARHDVGFAFVDELNRQGYAKPPTADLVRAGQHGVQATYLREMGALGYRLGTLDPLITLRDHGITPDYVREMGEQGYKGLSAEDIRQARDHGITPETVRGMREGGYGSLSLAEIVKARGSRHHTGIRARNEGRGLVAHCRWPNWSTPGTTALRRSSCASWAARATRSCRFDMLLKVRDHGVTPEYVREMKGLGYSLSPEELVRARDHGVTTECVREMAALGYGNPADRCVDSCPRPWRVTAEHARELKTLGYDKLPLDDLVTLRDNGLTAERIRSANSRAGTKLPIDLLNVSRALSD